MEELIDGSFVSGDVYPSGDCGKYEAGIHHVGTEQGGTDKMWWQRIVVYGETEKQAEILRDYILEKLQNER